MGSRRFYSYKLASTISDSCLIWQALKFMIHCVIEFVMVSGFRKLENDQSDDRNFRRRRLPSGLAERDCTFNRRQGQYCANGGDGCYRDGVSAAESECKR